MMRRGSAVVMAMALLLSACGDGGAGAPVVKAKSGRPKRVRETIDGALPMVPSLARELRGALAAHEFEKLEGRFAELQARWKADPKSEGELFAAFNAFFTADDELAAHLDAWVDLKPSATALTARGYYRCFCAHDRRGGRFASKTSEPRFAEYHRIGALAAADLASAVSLDPASIAPYWRLVNVEHVERGERRRLYEEALKLDPASFVLRLKYLHLLEPKWGGSMQEVQEVVIDARRHPDRLKALEGYPYYVSADVAYDDPSTAERLMSEGIQRGDVALFYRERARARVKLRRYKEAVEDCDRGIALAGEDYEILGKRGEAYYYAGMKERAQQDFDVVLELQPTTAWHRYLRGVIRCDRGDLEGALADEQLATHHDPSLGLAWEKAGFLLMALERPGEAVTSFEQAMQVLSPERQVNTRFLLATAKYMLKDEGALEDLKVYVDGAGKDDQGANAAADWARKVLAASPEERWDHMDSNPARPRKRAS